MTGIDLTKQLRGYKSGWIALDKANKIIEYGKTFKDISRKVKNKKDEVVLMPASDNYFGFVTSNG